MKDPVQKNRIFFILGVVSLLFFPFFLIAENIFCEICHVPIKGKYFRLNGKPCCSRNCVSEMRRRILPACALCGKPMTRFIKITSHNEEKNFCTACNRLPKCFHCKFPANNLQRLSDGRRFCRQCTFSWIDDPREGERLFRKVRNRLKRELALGTDHKITFSLADTRQIASLSKTPDSREWGLFVYRSFSRVQVSRSRATGRVLKRTPLPEKREYYIYILSHLSMDTFAQTAAHELMHDYMKEHYPHIKDPLWCEGASEYAASLYNIISKSSGRNLALEKNDDPVYGGGYRMFKRWIPDHLSPREKMRKLKLLLASKDREEQKKSR